jgi:hypothetical protein
MFVIPEHNVLQMVAGKLPATTGQRPVLPGK